MAKHRNNNLSFRICLLGAVLLGMCAGARAEQLPVRNYTIADGLAHDQIGRIVQDSHGFLWFCTADGLSRFDGYRFTNYGVKDGIGIGHVNDILESRRSGVYWVATNGGGISRFDPASASRSNVAGSNGGGSPALFQSYRVGDTRSSNIVNALYEDRAGNIWVGTQGGLFRLDADGGEVKFVRVEIGIESRPDRLIEIMEVVEDREGSLWVATNFGVLRRLPDGRVLHHPLRTAQGTDIVWALLYDAEGRLWFGHQTGLMVALPLPAQEAAASGASWQLLSEDGTGATKNKATASGRSASVDGRNTDRGGRNMRGADGHDVGADGRLHPPESQGEARWYTTGEGLAQDNVVSLYRASDGQVWVGTRGGGVSVFDGARFRSYARTHGLSSRINALAEDRDGNVWVGTQNSGAMKVARSGFRSYGEGDGLIHTDIISIFEDEAGDLYVVGGKWSVHRFDGERFTAVRLNLPKHILDYSAGRWAIIRDRAGEWWAATGEGLYRFPRVRRFEELAHAPPVAVYTTREGLADNNISRLFADSRDDIWIGSYNPPVTLTRWERATATFSRYAEADGIPPFNWANVFNEDATGALWIGLHNGGLARRRNGRFEVFGAAEGVPEGLGQGLYFDRAGRLWVATNAKGVRVEDTAAERPRIVPLTAGEPLASDNIRCFVEDEAGHIFVGTVRGVDRLDPRTGRVEHFTTADGLAKSETVTAFRDRRGSLWFGTREGLSRYVPAAQRTRPPPSVLIGGLSIAGVPYPVSELGETEFPELVLQPGQNQIELNFFSIDFSAGEDLRYQYKIEGVNADWSALTEQRTVTANLASGKYRFLVRAVNADGASSTVPATVAFKILPPIWQRWWFVALGALVLAAVVYVIGRYRVARAVELERVRTRIATDLHDDIGSSLSQIAILSEVVGQRIDGAPSPVTEPLSLIATTSREMVDSMSDIVWAINPKRDHLSDLAQRMRRFASDVLSARDIGFRFRTPEAEGDVRLGVDLRREVYLMFKETINNLVKHSGSTEADIEFRIEGDALTFRVSDDGVGFDAGATANGNHTGMGGHGLPSMRRRAEALGGSYEVESAKGRGTTVRLKIPLAGRRRKIGGWKLLHK